MREIDAVKLKLKAVCPKMSTEAVETVEDAIWTLVDVYGIPEASNKVLTLLNDILDDYLSDEE